MNRLAAVVAAAFIAGFAFSASAQTYASEDERREAARAEFQRGNAAYVEGNYAVAIESFEAANEILPNPRLLEYIAQCHINLGDYPAAIESYEAYAASSEEAAVEVEETLVTLRSDVVEYAIFEAVSTIATGISAGLNEQPPTREQLRWELGTQMRDVSVQITSDPRGAEVYIDDVEYGPFGVTPLETRLFTGRHLVEVRAPGFETARQVINVTVPRRGESIPVVNIELERARVPVEVEVTPVSAQVVFVDAEGNTTALGQGAYSGSLPSGRGTFLIQQGGADRSVPFEIAPSADGSPIPIALFLDEVAERRAQIQIGFLIIDTDLDDVTIFVDGGAVGSGPGVFEVDLVPGEHTVEVRRDGYLSWSTTVEIESNDEVRLIANPALERARGRGR